jgi:hypothetical protein
MPEAMLPMLMDLDSMLLVLRDKLSAGTAPPDCKA